MVLYFAFLIIFIILLSYYIGLWLGRLLSAALNDGLRLHVSLYRMEIDLNQRLTFTKSAHQACSFPPLFLRLSPTRKVAVVIVDLNQQFRFNSIRFTKKIATL
jgi:hypothetical protein